MALLFVQMTVSATLCNRARLAPIQRQAAESFHNSWVQIVKLDDNPIFVRTYTTVEAYEHSITLKLLDVVISHAPSNGLSIWKIICRIHLTKDGTTFRKDHRSGQCRCRRASSNGQINPEICH